MAEVTLAQRDLLTGSESFVQRTFPASEVFRSALVDEIGFGILQGTGITLVYVDRVDDGQPWSLHVVRGVAIDVPEIGDSLAWVNQKNRDSLLEKFYCAISDELGVCAVVGEHLMHNSMLEPMSQSAASLLFGMLNLSVGGSAQESAEFLSKFRGRSFERQDLGTLFMINAG